MGVFALFRRKSKGAAGTSTEEVSVDTPTAASGEGAADVSGDTADSTKEADGGAAEAGGDATDPTSAPGEPSGSSGSSDQENVEIPKQQSAEEAADNEAGEGARQ